MAALQIAVSSAQDHSTAYAIGQILGLFLLVGILYVLVKRSRARSRAREVQQPVMEMPAGLDMPASFEMPAAAPDPEPEFDVSAMDSELEEIYERVGVPDGVGEARDKIRDLAGELSRETGCSREEALHRAYETSLAEHREYLAAKGPA